MNFSSRSAAFAKCARRELVTSAVGLSPTWMRCLTPLSMSSTTFWAYASCSFHNVRSSSVKAASSLSGRRTIGVRSACASPSPHWELALCDLRQDVHALGNSDQRTVREPLAGWRPMRDGLGGLWSAEGCALAGASHLAICPGARSHVLSEILRAHRPVSFGRFPTPGCRSVTGSRWTSTVCAR
jgi:hypothetical protein